jgi:hypothetical protein
VGGGLARQADRNHSTARHPQQTTNILWQLSPYRMVQDHFEQQGRQSRQGDKREYFTVVLILLDLDLVLLEAVDL